MSNKEILKNINIALAHANRVEDQLKAINAHVTWQDMHKIKRRLEELAEIFELEEQKGEKDGGQ